MGGRPLNGEDGTDSLAACIFKLNRRFLEIGELEQRDENTLGDRVSCNRYCCSAHTKQLVQGRAHGDDS
jgi:hypothetical protein